MKFFLVKKKQPSILHYSRLTRLRRIACGFCNRYQFQYHTRSSDIKIAKLIIKRKPFKLYFPHQRIMQFIFPNFKKNIETAKAVKRFLKSTTKVLDVQASLDQNFSGLQSQQQIINMRLKEFLNYQGKLHLYIAQFPIFQALKLSDFLLSDSQLSSYHKKTKEKLIISNNSLKKQLFQINRACLHQIQQRGLKIPHFIEKVMNKIYAINMWYSKNSTISSWHYDSHDNFLCVFSGVKIVDILPPDDKQVITESILSNQYNQVLSINGEIGLLDNLQSQYINKNSRRVQRFMVKENQVLFIPQGWFHRVQSLGEDIMALNFWFDSVFNICNKRENYLFSYLLHQKVEKEVELFIKTDITEKNQQLLKQIQLKIGDFDDPLKILNYIQGNQLPQSQLKCIFYLMHEDKFQQFILFCLMSDPIILQHAFLNMDIVLSEIVTKKFETIDTKIQIQDIAQIQQIGLDSYIQEKQLDRERFYKNLWNTIDQEKFTQECLSNKSKIRKICLQRVLNMQNQ